MRYEAASVLITVSLSITLVGCSGDRGQSTNEVRPSALTVTSDEPGPAAREVIAVEVRSNGDIVCTKTDGGFWTSPEGGHVEFYLNDVFATNVFYDPQPPEGGIREVVFSGGALSLGQGSGYWAQCVAVPNIDVREDPNWDGELCININTGLRDVACFRSGIYGFNIIEAPDEPEPEPQPRDDFVDSIEDVVSTNCGGPIIDPPDNHYCTGNHWWGEGVYSYEFECEQFSGWTVKMTTSRGRTSLRVHDGDGIEYGASSSTATHDTIDFEATGAGGMCTVEVTAHVDSKFLLKWNRSGANPAVDGFNRTVLKQTEPGDILVGTFESGCAWTVELEFALGETEIDFGEIPPKKWCHAALVVEGWPNVKTIEIYNSDTFVILDEHVVKNSSGTRTGTWADPTREIGLYRVITTEDVKQRAIGNAIGWIGQPYSNMLDVALTGDLETEESFYCSKIPWFAYNLEGINLDPNGWIVFPDNLVDSSYTFNAMMFLEAP